jgi:glucose-1-phosphate thymidylyltransferase
MKGIILAAGLGTRLYPITTCVSKQLLPVYNKPMIYYPLSVLMLAGIREILIICNPRDKKLFEALLGDGSQIGIEIIYKEQKKPNGISEAFIIGEEFIGDDNVALMLGDNILYGYNLQEFLASAVQKVKNGTEAIIFGYPVQNPSEYGVVEYDKDYKVLSLREKPKNPKSNCAVVGLYMYNNSVISKAKKLKPSSRGELEITDLNKKYLRQGKLFFEHLGRGFAWFDTGTCETYYEAANFIRSVERRQGLMISNIEEIAYRLGYVDEDKLKLLAGRLGRNQYRNYLLDKVLKLGEQND